jgi:predicted ABC-type ATPase
MIINTRGTSGSGKSTVVRRLLDHNKHKQVWSNGTEEVLVSVPTADEPAELVPAFSDKVYDLKRKKYELLGYQLTLPGNHQRTLLGNHVLRIVGKYETPCGGCDGIKTQDLVEGRVRQWHAAGYNVLFEGLLISDIYTRWAQLAKDVGLSNMVFAFLDTPLDVCIERVKGRRTARGNDKPLNETGTRQKWDNARRVYAKFDNAGISAFWFNGDDLFESLHSGKFFEMGKGWK